MKVSVVIPTLNEESWLGATLASIRDQPGPWEIIVCDGGSEDRTCAVAAQVATVIQAPRGRASQMNAGAGIATGDVLLFLHADTRLSSHAFTALRGALMDTRVEAGSFRLQFNHRGFWANLMAACARIRWHLMVFGDRGLFVRRQVFQSIGGYPEIALFEDLQIVRTLRKRGGLVYLPVPVYTASRRFEQSGPVRQLIRNIYLWLRYLAGVNPARDAERYGPFRPVP